jgi:signal transduction histidine kinase
METEMPTPVARRDDCDELHSSLAEERALREMLVRRNRELSALHAVATAVTLPMHLNELLLTALDKVLHVTGVDVGSVYLLSEETGGLELRAHRGASEQVAQAMSRLHLDDSGCGGVIEKGRPIVIPDINVYRAGARRTLNKAGLSSLVHVPLACRGLTLGTLCVGTRAAREFAPDEVDLIAAIGNQIALGVENARLYDELARRDHLRGELLDQVITAQEEERKRIARDLHDDTSQALSALMYSLEAAEATCAAAEVKPALTSMRQRVAQIIEGVHKLIFDLRPSMLDHLGLFVALRWYAETRLEQAGIRLRLEEKGTLRRLPPPVETALFRVAQEALNNIAKHAGARNVQLVFDCRDGMVGIDVRDDGIGFDLAEVARSTDKKRGLGLVGMRERVGLVGGEITINSTPGSGTHVAIRVPAESAP